MAQSIATAYVDIMPSTRGLKAALEKEVTPVAKQVGTSTGKAMGDAITAETSRGVGPAMKKVLSDAATEGKVTFRTKIKGIGASLSDEFNSTGKISGTLRTVGESMGVTGEKARTLTNAFGQVTGATRAMGGGLSSVTSLLGGPWGIAIAGAGIALGSFAQAQDNARKAGEALAATLDPKTGAAGSVVDLFAQPQLNHHTQLQGGVLADACGTVLRDFFAERREQYRQRRAAASPASAVEALQVDTALIPAGEALELPPAHDVL